ncbi:MAG: autotransporter outer membrane beta-barrel domain-containing protein, partial [Gammaproteobacteria bacterium]|nr:autotransporter outer membrane beta-barrel domain-containing protein [Gammaproteobacteria bacterium]
NDVMRAWQLRLKQFSSPRNRRDRGSLSPTGDDGEVVADTRGQDDSQTPVRIQRTGSGLMMNSMSGMNAGDSNYLYGAWGSYSYTDFENDFASTAFDGQRHGGLIGLDVSPWDGVLLGVAVGYEDSDIDTDFNLGNQETDGFTIAPYLGALINDTWSVSASFGYSSLDTDQFRTLGTTTFTSSPDSDRWFAMFNLNGLTTYDNWIIGGQIGVLWARNELDAYTETSSLGATTRVAEMDAKLAQWNIGADVAYSYGEFEPFARVMYENDFSQTEIGVIGGPQPSFDDDDVMLGFGMRYFGANNLTGNLEFNTRLDRDDYDEYDISATIRYDW